MGRRGNEDRGDVPQSAEEYVDNQSYSIVLKQHYLKTTLFIHCIFLLIYFLLAHLFFVYLFIFHLLIYLSFTYLFFIDICLTLVIHDKFSFWNDRFLHAKIEVIVHMNIAPRYLLCDVLQIECHLNKFHLLFTFGLLMYCSFTYLLFIYILIYFLFTHLLLIYLFTPDFLIYFQFTFLLLFSKIYFQLFWIS